MVQECEAGEATDRTKILVATIAMLRQHGIPATVDHVHDEDYIIQILLKQMNCGNRA